MRFNTRLFLFFIAVCLYFPLSGKALTDPGQYTPPVNSEGLYPTPDDPNFPQPGNFMRETIGFTVDDVNDTVKYFRSDEFMSSMKTLRRETQSILDQYPGNPQAQAAAFPSLQQRAQAKVVNHVNQLKEKLNYNLAKPWLNDNICENIDTACPVVDNVNNVDEKIKADITAFFNTQILKIQSYTTQISEADTVKDLQNIIDSIQVYTDNQILRDQAKSIGARVLSQRLLAFSKFIQDWVVFIDCLAPKLATAGFDVEYYNTYMRSMGSRFKTDWYQTTEIRDPKRPWETFTFVLFDEARSTRQYTSHGAKWEYWTAHNILKASTCKGNTKCKEDTTQHMRAAKYNLQDMFHIFYGFYDRIQKQIESGKAVTGGVLATCKMPDSSAAPQGGGVFANPTTGAGRVTYSPTKPADWGTTTPSVSRITTPAPGLINPTSRPTSSINYVQPGVPTNPPVSTDSNYSEPTIYQGWVRDNVRIPTSYLLPSRRIIR